MLEDKEKKETKLNYRKANEVLKLSHKILEVFYIFIFIILIYMGIKVFQELNILRYVLEILGILSPLFIGIIIAWLFNPIVNFMQKKGIKRVFGIVIVYVILIGLIALLVGSILPILYDQIVSFAQSIPSLFTDLENFMNGILDRFSNIEGININQIKDNVISQLENFGANMSSTLPSYVINTVSTLVSGISTFVIGLIIGFFILLRSNNVGDTLITLVPKKWRKDVAKLANSIDDSLRSYILGVIIDAILIFIICSLVFSLIGLRAPLLFAIFCAITNVIPYVGPYIGAVPALIVGFSISPTTGILTLIAIVVIQFFEGNFLQEYIMSKTTKLNPVTIIIGLLVFGHYWGILGMVVSTPLLAIVKQFWTFFDDKYDFFNSRGEENE